MALFRAPEADLRCHAYVGFGRRVRLAKRGRFGSSSNDIGSPRGPTRDSTSIVRPLASSGADPPAPRVNQNPTTTTTAMPMITMIRTRHVTLPFLAGRCARPDSPSAGRTTLRSEAAAVVQFPKKGNPARSTTVIRPPHPDERRRERSHKALATDRIASLRGCPCDACDTSGSKRLRNSSRVWSAAAPRGPGPGGIAYGASQL